MKQPVVTLMMGIMLTSCVAPPTRLDKEEFTSLAQGKIDSELVPEFVDCITDRFNASHYMLTNFEVRQHRRAAGYRVETYTGSFNYLLVSVDVLNSGHVEMFESSSAALINTKGEREAFHICLQRYAASESDHTQAKNEF